ncbi:MAG TPA: potassium channel family protein, partial [Verrucomicrobiae bacterium]|nr:potassium channel family protein [Verrucomicrobiae bacterium]
MKPASPPTSRNRDFARQFRDRLTPVFLGLVILPLLGTAGYHWIEGWNFIDSLYMTVTTLATVGFGEVHPLTTGGRVFTMVLILSGGVLAAYSLGQLAHFFFAGEWRQYWEAQKRNRMLAELSNHIIVCGYGRMGSNVSRELKTEGLPFAVIDPSPERIEAVRAAGHLGILGDASHESVLREAGIDRARGLVAAAKADAENVFIVLTARSLRPNLAIVARAELDESEAKLRRAGANRVILPYHTTGRR